MNSDSDNEKLAGATVHTEQDVASDGPVYTEEMERKAIRKLDWHIVPMVMWIYLMNFMDRGEYQQRVLLVVHR